jgi:alpha-beta hydrolase superfamily lysophospholipase
MLAEEVSLDVSTVPVSLGGGTLASLGQTLHWRAQSPVTTIASVIVVHGIGEHQGRYDALTDAFVGSGIALYGYDQRGHGRSTGVRGHVDQWDQYVTDLRTMIEFVQQLEGDKPLFIFGHSMGALVALDCTLRFPKGITGLMINGIPLRPGTVAKPMLIRLAKLLSAVKPDYAMSLGLDLSGLSTKPEVAIEYASDPLVQTQVTARWGVSILKAIERLRGDVVNLKTPLLVTHGSLDPINLPAGSQELFSAVAAKDKALKLYYRSRHEVHNDVDAAEFVNDLCNWVLPRTGATKSL